MFDVDALEHLGDLQKNYPHATNRGVYISPAIN